MRIALALVLLVWLGVPGVFIIRGLMVVISQMSQ
jgi:hypothetical protein